jgi:hypothetical protein
MYFSTSDGREVTTKRQLDGSVQPGFSRNFFSGTAEGIELKSGVHVPMNIFHMCCYCLRHLKIQNGHQQRSKFALKPYGKQHFHLLLENSRTEFNQTWQRCFL